MQTHLKQLQREFRPGFKIGHSAGSGHYFIIREDGDIARAPDGQPVVVSGTPRENGPHYLKRIRQHLRESGILAEQVSRRSVGGTVRAEEVRVRLLKVVDELSKHGGAQRAYGGKVAFARFALEWSKEHGIEAWRNEKSAEQGIYRFLKTGLVSERTLAVIEGTLEALGEDAHGPRVLKVKPVLHREKPAENGSHSTEGNGNGTEKISRLPVFDFSDLKSGVPPMPPPPEGLPEMTMNVTMEEYLTMERVVGIIYAQGPRVVEECSPFITNVNRLRRQMERKVTK